MLLERDAFPKATAVPRLWGGQFRPRSVILAMAVLVALFGAATWSLFLWIDHRREFAAAEANGGATLDALEQHVRRLVDTNELLLQQVLHLLSVHGIEAYQSQEPEWRHLRNLAFLAQHSTILTFVDPSGRVLLSTRGFGPRTPTTSAAGAAALAELRDAGHDELHVGPTILSPADGHPFLLFSRRWHDEAGSFRGVVTSAVRADTFLEFAEKLVFGPRSSLSVIRDDGLILIRRPMTAEVVNMRLGDYELFTEHLRRGPTGSYPAVSPADGERRIVFFRRLDDLPLIAVTGMALDDVLADWRRHAYQASALVLAGLLAIGGLALLGVRHATREEEALRELSATRAHEQLLVSEIDHRSKNLLSIIRSLVRQTAQTTPDKAAFEQAILGRIQALAAAHELLSEEKWTSADLRSLVERELRPFADAARLAVDGEPVRVPPKAAMTIAMALHELATNAAKYGAWSVPGGRVDVSWRVAGEERRLRLSWVETGGPTVRAPASKGFGTTLLERTVAHDLGGSVAIDYGTAGLCAEIDLPLPRSG